MLLEEGVCYDQCILLAKLVLAFALLHFVLKSKFACYSRYLLTSYFCILQGGHKTVGYRAMRAGGLC